MPWVSLPGGNWVLGMPRVPLLELWVNKMFHTVRVAPVTGLCDACDLRLVEDTRLGLVGEGQAGIRRGRGSLVRLQLEHLNDQEPRRCCC